MIALIFIETFEAMLFGIVVHTSDELNSSFASHCATLQIHIGTVKLVNNQSTISSTHELHFALH